MTNYYDIPKVGEAEFTRPDFPQWYQGELKRISAANQALYRQAIEQDEENYRSALERYAQMLALAQSIYGDRSSVIAYLGKHKPRRFAGLTEPPNFRRRANTAWNRYEVWLEDKQRRDYTADYRKRRADMNAMLQELGYVPGEHYKKSRAITFAKTVVNPEQPQVRMLPEGDKPS